MREYTSIWQTDPVPLNWSVGKEGLKDRLTDVPLPSVALGIVALLFVATVSLTGTLPENSDPVREQLRHAVAGFSGDVRELQSELELKNLEVERLQQIQGYSAEFRVPANLATLIYDIALAEGLDPELGFRLVRVESGFRRNVVSPKGAIGYSQILPSTARWLDPTVETKDLFETQTNLHLGFRYLNYLLEEYRGDMRLALLAYNRGPNRVQGLLSRGVDPANGYAKAVLGE